MTQVAKLSFPKHNRSFDMAYTNDPVKESKAALEASIEESKRTKNSIATLNRFVEFCFNPEIILETDDRQLSWKNEGIDTAMFESTAILSLIHKGQQCRFKGWLREIKLGEYIAFHITETLDDSAGFRVTERYVTILPEEK